MKARFLSLALAGLLWAGLALAKVNVNTASLEELDSLYGIGETRAQAIIDYRRQHGPFKSLRDLKKVPELPDGVVEGLKGKVSFSGATQLDSSEGNVGREATKPRPKMTTAEPQAMPAKPLANPASAPARPATPAMPGKAPEAKSAPRSDVPAKPAADARPMPAPARPAVPVVAGKVAAEGKSAVPVAPAAPAKPAGPAMSSAARPAAPAAPSTPSAAPAAPAKPAAPARPVMAN